MQFTEIYKLLFIKIHEGNKNGSNKVLSGLLYGFHLSPLMFKIYTASIVNTMPKKIQVLQYAGD